MYITCKVSAYHLITGEKRFTRGSIYLAKINANTLLALDDKGEWSAVSFKTNREGILDNEVFKLHFQVSEEEKNVHAS